MDGASDAVIQGRECWWWGILFQVDDEDNLY